MFKVGSMDSQEKETNKKMFYMGNQDKENKEVIEKTSYVANLDSQQKDAIEKLRKCLKDIISPDMYEDSHLFYRFLKARDFNINKADYMLRQHIIWRKAHQIDTIVKDFKPSPIFQKYIRAADLGEDKAGNTIRYCPLGDYHIRDLLSAFKINEMLKHWMWTFECIMVQRKKMNKITEKKTGKFTVIANLDKLQLTNVTHPASIAYLIRIAKFFQDNFPETLNAFYIINAPAYYALAWSVVKKVLAVEVINKIHVYGRNGWKEELLRVIDPEVLPAFLGGNKTDPDGNPRCDSFICHGGRIPSEYFLSKEDRTFKDISQVKHITVSPKTSREISVDATECGSVIQWEFEIESKDIGFGLYFKESEEVFKEILPVYRYETTDGTEVGSYKCQLAGTYVFIFDNTFSWINTKEVSYVITVTKP